MPAAQRLTQHRGQDRMGEYEQRGVRGRLVGGTEQTLGFLIVLCHGWHRAQLQSGSKARPLWSAPRRSGRLFGHGHDLRRPTSHVDAMLPDGSRLHVVIRQITRPRRRPSAATPARATRSKGRGRRERSTASKPSRRSMPRRGRRGAPQDRSIDARRRAPRVDLDGGAGPAPTRAATPGWLSADRKAVIRRRVFHDPPTSATESGRTTSASSKPALVGSAR